MARSLARNTKVYASTLTKAQLIADSLPDNTNTFEIKVLDGYSFSQDTTTQEIGINEAGDTPVRGTRGFNTALNPVDVSISTYVRAYIDSVHDTDYGECTEKVLWASAMGTLTGFTNSATAGSETGVHTYDRTNGAGTEDIIFNLTSSNANALLPLTLVFKLDDTCYIVEDFNVSTAEVDFSIDGIATINWSGFGSTLSESEALWAVVDAWVTDGTDYMAVPSTTANTFIRNKLSTLVLTDNQVVASPAIAADTLASTTATTLTLTTGGLGTADLYVGGRIRNTGLTPDEWVTIVSHTATVVTVAGGDVDTLAGWGTEACQAYLPSENAAVIYNIPITGATLTMENNTTYLTPEELAVVNTPLAGFAGNRITSGSFTAYLNTGAAGSAGLLQDLLEKTNDVSNDFTLTFQMGGPSTVTTLPQVYFLVPHAQIGIPTSAVEDVLSTEITFTAQPWTGNSITGNATFEDTNEITIQYLPAT